MMIFVHEDVAVLCDQILNLAFSVQALDDGNIYESSGPVPSGSNLTNQIDRQIKERRKALARWSKSCARCTSTRVLVRRAATTQAAATVLPNAVRAQRTPSSCLSSLATASGCLSRSIPVNTTFMGFPPGAHPQS